MAVSQKPAVGVQVVVSGAGSVASPATAPFDNTHTIVILNNTAAVDGFAAFQSDDTQITATTGMVIPGGSSLTLSVGSKSQRPQDGSTLRFDGAQAVTFQLTYINGMDL